MFFAVVFECFRFGPLRIGGDLSDQNRGSHIRDNNHRLGEEVAVAILPNDGVAFVAADLWKHLDGKIASFKVPNHVVIMNEPLPRNAAGKFLKRELRDLVEKGSLKAVSR